MNFKDEFDISDIVNTNTIEHNIQNGRKNKICKNKSGGSHITDTYTHPNDSLVNKSNKDKSGGLDIKKLKVTSCICAERLNKKNDKCASKSVKKIIAKYDDEHKSKQQIDILESRTFQTQLNKNEFDKVYTDLVLNFKPTGPKYTTDWLSNIEIDQTMIQWTKENKEFYGCEFCTIDFESIIESSLSKLDLNKFVQIKEEFTCIYEQYNNLQLRKKNIKTIGCIVNSDTSYGPGKHWFAVFFDLRTVPWRFEYFNSSGNPPYKEIVMYMENLKKRYGNKIECITTTSIEHQQSETECGLYSLYYIRSRILKIPMKYFRHNRVKDKDMIEFRKYLFR